MLLILRSLPGISIGAVRVFSLNVTLVGMFAVNPGFYLDIARDPIFVFGFPSLLALYLIGFVMIRRMVDLKV